MEIDNERLLDDRCIQMQIDTESFTGTRWVFSDFWSLD
jgi:hypothetical protein